MKENKITYLLVGAVSVFVIFLIIILVATRADRITQTVTQTKTIDQSLFDQTKSKVSNLQNFGNLPLSVSPDEIGKTNPFAKE